MSFFRSLLGCGKKTEYSTVDIRSVSISCGHMNYSYSYSFFLRRTENGWLLDADFAADTEQAHTEYEACPIAEEDAKELLNIVQGQDTPGKLLRYKKPRIRVQAPDETVYYTSVLFADGKQAAAPMRPCDDLETCFYRLAGKYAGTIPETNDAEASDKEESF